MTSVSPTLWAASTPAPVAEGVAPVAGAGFANAMQRLARATPSAASEPLAANFQISVPAAADAELTPDFAIAALASTEASVEGVEISTSIDTLPLITDSGVAQSPVTQLQLPGLGLQSALAATATAAAATENGNDTAIDADVLTSALGTTGGSGVIVSGGLAMPAVGAGNVAIAGAGELNLELIDSMAATGSGDKLESALFDTAAAAPSRAGPLRELPTPPPGLHPGVKVSYPAELPFGHQEWAERIAERSSALFARGLNGAELQLDPPELGALQIRIHVRDDVATVQFISPHAHVRDALDQTAARLREMLSEQGFRDVQTDISGGREQARRDGSDDPHNVNSPALETEPSTTSDTGGTLGAKSGGGLLGVDQFV